MQAVVVARGLYACTVEFVRLVIFWQAKAWISVWFTLSPVRVLIWDAGAQPLLIVILNCRILLLFPMFRWDAGGCGTWFVCDSCIASIRLPARERLWWCSIFDLTTAICRLCWCIVYPSRMRYFVQAWFVVASQLWCDEFLSWGLLLKAALTKQAHYVLLWLDITKTCGDVDAHIWFEMYYFNFLC